MRKSKLIQLGQILYDRHLVLSRGGNISCRYPSGEYLISASGTHLGFLQLTDILKINEFGEVVEKEGSLQEPSSEVSIHLAIYQEFPLVHYIIHAHPPYICSWALIQERLVKPIIPYNYETKMLIEKVAVIEDQGNQKKITCIEKISEHVRNGITLIVVYGHGIVSVGETFIEAIENVELFESVVKVLLLVNDEKACD